MTPDAINPFSKIFDLKKINAFRIYNCFIHSCFQTGGYFRYVDGWHMTFASWAEGEPSRGKPCVYMDIEGKWWTAFCNQTLNSVCMQTTGRIAA